MMKRLESIGYGILGGVLVALLAPFLLWAAQTYVLPGTPTPRAEVVTYGPQRDEALRSLFSGTAAPTSPTPVEGQPWYETDTDIFHVYNGTSWLDVPFLSISNAWTASQTINGASSPLWSATDSTNSVAIEIQADDTQGYVGTSTNHPACVQTNNNCRVTISADGSTITYNGTYNGTYTLGGTPTFSVMPGNTAPCLSGYTRKAFNFCSKDNASTTYTWTDAATCTSRSVQDAVPSTARAVLMRIVWKGYANNSAGAARSNQVKFFGSTDCNSLTEIVKSNVQFIEWNASSPGANLGEFSDQLIVPLVSDNTFYTTQSNSGGNGFAEILNYNTEGYFDK